MRTGCTQASLRGAHRVFELRGWQDGLHREDGDPQLSGEALDCGFRAFEGRLEAAPLRQAKEKQSDTTMYLGRRNEERSFEVRDSHSEVQLESRDCRH